jgi:hypothetical protein
LLNTNILPPSFFVCVTKNRFYCIKKLAKLKAKR